MIVNWGEPSNFTLSSIYLPALSWESCVDYCSNQDNCALAYSTVFPINCQVFEERFIWSVKKLDAVEGKLVAFKVLDTPGSCPFGENAPTFNNQTAFGNDYNITFDGDFWNFSFQKLKCEEAWTQFNRPITDYCLKVFVYPSDLITQSQATDYCSQLDATLSGVESENERWFITNSSWSVLGSDFPQISAVWVSGTRKPECADRSQDLNYPYCEDKYQQFDFTDRYMTTYSGMYWDLNQPDKDVFGSFQNCILLWLRLPWQYSESLWTSNPNGAVDDAWCDAPNQTWFGVHGFVCGKLPTVPVL